MLGERVFNIGKRSGKGTWGDRRGTQDLTEWRERRSGLTFWYVQAAEGKEEPHWKPKQGRVGWKIQARDFVHRQHDSCDM